MDGTKKQQQTIRYKELEEKYNECVIKNPLSKILKIKKGKNNGK